MICACPCGRPVKPGYRFAGRGCWMRTPEGRQKASEIGKKGGMTERLSLKRAAILARVAHLSREDAIWEAVQWAWKVERSRACVARRKQIRMIPQGMRAEAGA